MKKLVVLLFTFMLLGSSTANAHGDGLRPGIAEVPEYKYTVGVPLIPVMGITNFMKLGEIFSYISVMTKLNLPSSYDDVGLYSNEAVKLMDTLNQLHKKNIFADAVIIPARLFGLNTKFFELTIDGGIYNHTRVNFKGLEDEVTLADISMTVADTGWYHTSLNVGKQTLLHLRSTTLLGGEIWGIGKAPLNIDRYTLTLLAGVGLTIGYAHVMDYELHTESAVTMSAILADKMDVKSGLIWAMHGMVGAQFDGFKYLRPRVVLQFCGRPGLPGELPDLRPEFNLGVELKVWKIATLRAEVLDMDNPEYRVELSRGFGINSEVALGGIFHSEIYGKATGYLVVGLGGKPVKVTTTVLTDGKQVGVLFGVTVGYLPQ